MAHKVINGKVVIDWTTGDPEGDRLTLLAAYKDFLTELYNDAVMAEQDGDSTAINIFKRWSFSIDDQIDNVPRIWIKRPE